MSRSEEFSGGAGAAPAKVQVTSTYSGGRPKWHAVVGAVPARRGSEYGTDHKFACGKTTPDGNEEPYFGEVTCPHCLKKLSF